MDELTMNNIYSLLVDLRYTRGWRKEKRHTWFFTMTNMHAHMPLRKKPRERLRTIFESMENMVSQVETSNLFRREMVRELNQRR